MSRQFVNCPATEAHERHMATLKTISTAQARIGYIADVQRIEGKVAADWLRDDFAKWWQEQRSKERAK